ncbi:methyl-accepting chemotaxis protein [Shewanella sp. GXUN23E]|uniref:methyl-accepting chemotaxis protein n=1 Tax=Shewanella sp. GXUN23E TaxID=3422498 RepID=UPI003D7C8543
MSLSIKKKLTIFSVSIVACVCTLLAGISNQVLTVQTQQSVDTELSQIGLFTSSYISDWLQSHKHMVLVNEVAIAGPDDISPLLLHTKKTGGFLSVYAGFTDGSFVTGDKTENRPANYDAQSRPWYREAQQADDVILTAPYRDVNGSLVVSLAKSFRGERSGVLAADLTIDKIIDLVLETKVTNQGFAFLVDGNNKLLAYKDESLTGKPLTYIGKDLTSSLVNHIVADHEKHEFQWAGDQRTKWLTIYPVAGTDWRLGIVMDKDTAMQAVEEQATLNLLMSLGLFICVALLTTWIIGRLLQPLQELKQAVDELSQGDADLSHRLTLVRQDEIGEVALSVNRFIALLQQLIGGIASNTRNLDELVLATGHNVAQTTRAVERQRNQVDQVATAIHEMSVSAREVASHAEMTAEAAKDSADACEQGQTIITENLNAIGSVAEKLQGAELVIRELDENVQGIHRILSNIQGIADQTNLLALNAAIEAARAGAQGRGFAVVADEVRVLSQRTHAATEEVGTMIKTLQQNAALAVAAMEDSAGQANLSVDCANRASDRLGQITVGITQISQMAIQIASAAEEQRAVSEEISRNTQEVKDAAEDVSTQAQSSEQQCMLIQEESRAIHKEINRFRL